MANGEWRRDMKIAVIKIEGCGECPYISSVMRYWDCNHHDNDRPANDSKVNPERIPEWCPLPDKEA